MLRLINRCMHSMKYLLHNKQFDDSLISMRDTKKRGKVYIKNLRVDENDV